MKRNRILTLALCLAMTVTLVSGCQKKPTQQPDASAQPPASSAPTDVSQPAEPPVQPEPALAGAKVMVLSGPTGVGAAKMMADSQAAADNDPGSPTWDFTVVTDNTEVTAALNSGETDIAAIATNVASNLYNKTDGKITMLALNTRGVLYILEKGESVSTMADLKGKTIYATGQGANPEYILNYLLTQNGLDPAKDVTIQWLTAQEITAKMAASESGICMLPVPAATGLLMKDTGVRTALDLSAQWDKVAGSPLVMGSVVVRTEFLKENPDVVDAFLMEYKQSIDYMSDPANLDAAAELVAQYGITANAQIAKNAIPQCNLTFLYGSEMQQAVQGYYDVLYKADPAAIGGAKPYDDFYYIVQLNF